METRTDKSLLELIVSNVVLTITLALCGFVLGWLAGDLLCRLIHYQDSFMQRFELHALCASVFVLIGILAAQVSFFVHHARKDAPAPIGFRYRFTTFVVWILALGWMLWFNVKTDEVRNKDSAQGWPLTYYETRANSYEPNGIEEFSYNGNAVCNAVYCGTITLMIAALAEYIARSWQRRRLAKAARAAPAPKPSPQQSAPSAYADAVAPAKSERRGENEPSKIGV